MNLVLGRGKNRSVFTIPHGSVVKNAPEAEQKILVSNFCALAGIRQ